MAFSFFRTVTIDHTKCGASNSTDFPIVVTGTYTYLKTVANGGLVRNGNGYDIGFYSDLALTTKLDWETAVYTATTGVVEYWIRIPTLSHTVDTVIYMAYGDASITTDQSNKTGVWNSNYSAVYHFGDGTTLGLTDSTSHALTLTNNSAVAGAGQLVGGIVTSLTNYADNTSNLIGFTGWSLSAWIKTSAAADQTIIKISTNVGAGQEYILITTAGKLQVGDAGGGSGRTIGTSTNNDGNWHYLVGTYDGTYRAYVDGVFETSQLAATGHSVDGIWIGRDSSGSQGFVGTIDEAHALGGVTLLQDWITTEFNNQNNPSTFYTIGAQNGIGGGGVLFDTGGHQIGNPGLTY